MGDSRGHITNGLAFCAIGLWHFYNLFKLQAAAAPAPAPAAIYFRRLELLLILAGTAVSLLMELFSASLRRSPLAPDGSIPAHFLPHFEHSTIILAMLAYAATALLLDAIPNPSRHPLAASLAAVAFAIELLIFHLHSEDHAGLEGHYHYLLQLAIFTCLAATLLSAARRRSFAVAFVRSIGVLFQGVWMINTGFMLWTPWLIPKGCSMHKEDDGHYTVRCRTLEALKRAKGIATIQFCYYLLGTVAMALATYLVVAKAFGIKGEDRSVARSDGGDEVEAEQKCALVDEWNRK